MEARKSKSEREQTEIKLKKQCSKTTLCVMYNVHKYYKEQSKVYIS